MSFLSKQFIDVIQYTEPEDGILAYRYPMEDMEIQNGGKLTVRDSQMAVFVNEGRIAELEDKLARAEVIDVSKLSGDTITFGATVTLIDEDTDKKAVYQIVGEVEADAKKGKISITSPLARALIGKKKGVSVEVVAPGGAKAYEIAKVEWR